MRTDKQRGFIDLPDLRPLFFLAIVGLFALVAGVAALVWFIVKHVSWLP